MPSNVETCSEALEARGFLPVCTPSSEPEGDCRDIIPEPEFHALCMNSPRFTPIQAIMCVNTQTKEQRFFPYQDLFHDCEALGDPWTLAGCYCCCWGPFVAGPMLSSSVRAGGLQKGDVISVGSLSGDSVTWEDGEVSFVSGLDSEDAPAIYLLARGTRTYELLCSPNLPLVLSDGRLITAEHVRLGDVLLDDEGRECVVESSGVGNGFEPLYRIGNGGAYNGSLSGRLLSMNGLLVGDYELELHLEELPGTLLASEHKNRPQVGTTRQAQFMNPSGQAAGMTISGVSNSGRRDRTYLTSAQAEDVLANGSMMPSNDPRVKQNVDYATKLLSGFYPDVTFTYDDANLTPTVLASDSFLDGKTVQITAGLARQSVMKLEGIVMAVAWGVACLYAGKPENKQGYAAVGWADYYAFGVISREIWPNNFLTECLAALDQWKALFALVSPDNAQGNPKDPINDPSLDCRIEAAGCGMVGSQLPTCVTQPS